MPIGTSSASVTACTWHRWSFAAALLVLFAGCSAEAPPPPITLTADPAQQWPAAIPATDGTAPAMEELRTFTGHTGPITALAVSPGGARLASVSRDRSLRLWEVATGNLLQTVELPLEKFETGQALALFFDEGRQLLLADNKSILQVDLQTARINEQVFPLKEPLRSLELSGDEKWLALVTKSGTCQLLAADLQSPPVTLASVANQARAATFCPGDQQLAVGLVGEVLSVFDLASLLKDSTTSGAHPHWAKAGTTQVAPVLLAISNDAAQMAIISENHTLRSGPAPGAKNQNDLSTSITFSKLRGMAYLPGDEYLVAYGGDRLLEFCNTKDMALAGATKGTSREVTNALLSPGCQFAVSGYQDGTIKTFSLARPLETRPDYLKKITALRRNRDFDALEALLGVIRKDQPRRAADIDAPLLQAAYQQLYSPDSPHPDALAAVDTFIADYRVAKPESAAAMLLEARRHVQTGWKARGSGFVFSVTPEAMQTFEEELATARHLLLRALKFAPDDPAILAELILIARGSDMERHQLDEYIKACIKIDPRYYPIYESMAEYLLPRWHGQPGEVEQWALEMADTVGGDDGLVIHAKVALRVMRYESFDYIKAGAFSLDKLKAAAPILKQRNTGSMFELNSAARLACAVEDRATAHELFQLIGPNGWNSNVWPDHAHFSTMIRWADPAATEGEERLKIEVPPVRYAHLQFAPDGELLLAYSGGYGAGFNTYDAESGKVIEQQQIVDDTARNMVIGPQARQVAFFQTPLDDEAPAGTRTDSFVIWTRAAAQDELEPLVFEYPKGSNDFTEATFSADGSICFFYDGRGQIHQCDTDTMQVLSSMPHDQHPHGFHALDNDRLLLGTTGGKLEVWNFKAKTANISIDLDQGNRRATLLNFAVVPGGDYLIARIARLGLKKIILPSFELLPTADDSIAESDMNRDLTISPDGKWLTGRQWFADASRQADPFAIEVWDTSTLKLAHRFRGHLESVEALCFSADSKTLATVSSDRTIRLWDMEQVKPAK